MQTRFGFFVEHVIFAALLLTPAAITAQVTGNTFQQPASSQESASAQQNAAQDSQAVSQSGVFPVFAVTMNFNGSLVDGTEVPSKSANSGVDDSFQRAWEAMKSGGFNAILFKVELKDPQAAARVANLCIWAKANNVGLIPVLANASTGNAAATFPASVLSLLRGGAGQQSDAYTQLFYFQLESPFNVPIPTANMNLAESQKTLLRAVDSLRNAESHALQGTGVQATPIIVNASFDYELIQQGAIVGVPLDAAAEQRALESLKKSLLPLANAANVDAINVAWFPRSITSGDEGHFVALLREIEAALPGKKVLLDTGFSTAFNSGDQQTQFMTIALTNVAGFRANDGADGPFLGVTVSQAVGNSSADVHAPAGADLTKWNWNEKARQLAQMWSHGGQSAELTWWLEKVRAGRALLGNDMVASPGLQAIQQFSATVAQVSQSMAPAGAGADGQPVSSSAATPAATDASANASSAPAADAQSSGASSPSFFQQLLQNVIQQVTTQLTDTLVTKLTNKLTNSSTAQAPADATQNGGASYSANSSTPQPGSSSAGILLSPQDVTVDTATAATGQPVHITARLHNGSTDQDISGLTVQLVDSANPTSTSQVTQAGVAVPRSGVVPVQLTWTAAQSAAPPTLLVQVLDFGGSQVASAPVPAITLSNANPNANLAAASGNAGANAAAVTNATAADSNAGSQNAGNQPGQSGDSGNAGTNGANSGSQGAQGPLRLGFSSTQSGILATPVQPQIVFFGPVTTIRQNPPLSLQVTNPAGTLMRSAQAQLVVDGKPGQVQPLGPFLPNQTRSATFDGSAVPAGAQNIKVVVTTAEGGSATATASPAASHVQAVAPGVSAARAGVVQTGLPVRSGLPTAYHIGTVTIAPVVAPALTPVSSGHVSATPSTPVVPATQIAAPRSNVAPNPTGTATTITSPSPSNPAKIATVVPTVRANPAGHSTSVITPPTSSAQPANPASVRTIVPPAPSNHAGTATTAAAPSSARSTAVRTIAPQPSPGANPAGVKTIVPPTRSNQTAIATVTPLGNSSQPTGAKTVLPQGGTRANQTGTTTTVLPPNSALAGVKTASPSANPAGVKTIVPPTRSNQTAIATVTPLGNSSQPTRAKTVLPQGGTRANQTGTTTTVLPPNSALASGKTVVAPGPSGGNQSGTVTTILPPRSSGQMAAVRTATQQAGTTQAGSATTVLPPGRSLPGTAQLGRQGPYLDLSISAGDIHFRPAAAGQPLTCTALIRNLGTVGAQSASVVFMLNADGRTLSSRPSVFTIAAGGSFLASWTTAMPAAQSVQLAVQVTATGDINAANNQAAIRLH